jgi:hypothetical protein
MNVSENILYVVYEHVSSLLIGYRHRVKRNLKITGIPALGIEKGQSYIPKDRALHNHR